MGRVLNKDQFSTISVELPRNIAEALRAKAKAEHKTLTQLVREVVEQYLNEK